MKNCTDFFNEIIDEPSKNIYRFKYESFTMLDLFRVGLQILLKSPFTFHQIYNDLDPNCIKTSTILFLINIRFILYIVYIRS